MAGMNTVITIVGVGILAAAGWYAYKKGYLDDLVGTLGGLTGGLGVGGGETAPAGEEDPCIAECAAKSKMAYYDYYGYATKKEDEKKEKEEDEPKTTAAKCDCSKYTTPPAAEETPAPAAPKDEVDAIVAATGDCKKKFGGSCTTECKSKNSTKCKDCEKACGSSSKLAIAYAGSYYDGEVMDSAYYVTEQSSFIPRTRTNYGIAIA